MTYIQRLFLGLFLAVLSATVFAQTCVTTIPPAYQNKTLTEWWAATCIPTTGPGTDSRTCSAPSYVFVSGIWRFTGTITIKYGFNTSVQNPQVQPNCGFGGVGFVMNQTNGQCEKSGPCLDNPDCVVGSKRITNYTVGWATSTADLGVSNLAVDYGVPSPNMNDGKCKGSYSTITACYVSMQQASNGLYRASCDYEMTVTGTAQPGEGTDTHADPMKPEPPCPGTSGTVQGKPVCLDSTSSPPTPSTNPAGSSTLAGNPAAGARPTTGPGSADGGTGRTPVSGTGGNGGGSSSAAVPPTGTGGTGTGTDPLPQPDPCGAPGQPICAVKVDENGTPAAATAAGQFDGGVSGIEGVKNGAGSAINDAKNAPMLPGWSWSFQLPTGCSPYPMAAFGMSIDVCDFKPMIHDLMSLIWVSAGIFGLLALLRSAFSQG